MNVYKGYLTYTLALLAVAWGVAGWVLNWVDQMTALEVIWLGLAVFGVRRALPR